MTAIKANPVHVDEELRVGTIAALPGVLLSLGANPAEVLAEAGFDATLFDDPNNRISHSDRNHLISHCAARSGCAHLGLLVGSQAGLHSLGLVGLMVEYSPDAGTALRNLVRYLHLHIHGSVVSLETADELAILSYETYQPRVEATDQIADGALALMFNIMRTLCGPDWKPVEICFAHRKPDNTRPFRKVFQSPLRFDAGQNALVFAARHLDKRLPDVAPEQQRLLMKQIDALERRYSQDFAGQVRGLLRTALVSGQASSTQVATMFSIHSRTLTRRLADLGTNFQQLADEGRFEIARQMLKDSTMAVSSIASMLDYERASAFTRAFRRWSGATPTQWRESNGGERRARSGTAAISQTDTHAGHSSNSPTRSSATF